MLNMSGKLKQRCFKTKLLTMPFISKTSWPTRQEFKEFFEAKEDSNGIKIVSSDAFWKYSSAEAVEASLEIAYLIALAKNSHNIGKALIKPCMLKATSLVLGKVNRKELAKTSLSDSTVKTRIDEIAEDIELLKFLRK